MKALPTPAEMEARLRFIVENREKNNQKSKTDLDQDLDLKKFTDLDQRSRSSVEAKRLDFPYLEPVENPDGLDPFIRGQFETLLKRDPIILQARMWKTKRPELYLACITNALKLKGADWVRSEIQFVAGNTRVPLEKKGHYLSAVISRNARLA